MRIFLPRCSKNLCSHRNPSKFYTLLWKCLRHHDAVEVVIEFHSVSPTTSKSINPLDKKIFWPRSLISPLSPWSFVFFLHSHGSVWGILKLEAPSVLSKSRQSVNNEFSFLKFNYETLLSPKSFAFLLQLRATWIREARVWPGLPVAAATAGDLRAGAASGGVRGASRIRPWDGTARLAPCCQHWLWRWLWQGRGRLRARRWLLRCKSIGQTLHRISIFEYQPYRSR